MTQVLEYKIGQKFFFDKQKENQISFLKEQADLTKDLKEKYLIFYDIYKLYRFYNFDKTLEYIERSKELAECLGNDFFLDQTTLSLSLLLVESGYFKESIDALDDIDSKSIKEELINDYYLAYKEAYSGLSYYTVVNRNKLLYSQLYNAYKDSIFSRLGSNSEEVLRLKEKQFKEVNNLSKAIEINSKRLAKVKMGSREFSLITFERSLIYGLKKNTDKQKEYLILSAISDIEASVKDNASIGELAKLLFLEGDIDRAHEYINFSFDDANFYNSQLRYLNIASSLPIITMAYNEQRTNQKTKLKKSLIFISLLAFFLLITIYLIFRQVRKLSLARNKLKKANEKLKELNLKLNSSNEDLKQIYLDLSESNRIKEHYIGTFLNLYSEYIDKLDVYRKLVRKYIRANQMNKLFELSKSKKVIDGELEIFHKNFDNSFLHMHPNFVEVVNSLMKIEKQIILDNPSRLNTELRILALIKLGITNSSGIAKILRYSVHTIYNYRANIKNNSKDKKSFEYSIKNIL